MRPTVLVFASAVVLSGSAAFAEAPGEVDADPTPMGPSMVEPTSTAPAPCAMGQRWSIGFALGQASLAPKHSPDAQTDYAIGQLAVTYRATRHLELALELGGGKEQLPDGNAGDRELSTGTLGLRYRFNPGAAWNWWLMGGLGKTSIASIGATQQERDAAAKPHGEVGLGIERRFERFAVQAELRWVSIGNDHDHGAGGGKATVDTGTTSTGGSMPTPDQPPTMDPGTSKVPPPSTTTVQPPSTKLEGGQFTIGLSYYF